MDPRFEHMRSITRRHFLGSSALGVGGAALSWLMSRESWGSMQDGLATPHFAPRAKRVIYLHMAGSPPHLDLLDPKPLLNRMHAKDAPDELIEGKRFAFIKGRPTILGSPYRFRQAGASGIWVSELMPHFREIADEVTVIRSMHTDQFNHAPAQMFLYTGSPQLGRPSMGSWIVYGLGSEADNLPGFVVLVSGAKTPSAGKSVWGSGFLPSVHQGVQCRTSGDPVLYVSDPPGLDRAGRRRSLDALKELNEHHYDKAQDPETLSRIAQYELAFRMQVSVPDVMDIAQEDEMTLRAYGANPGQSSFANNCLLARRLTERGVRFVQLFDWGWDTHGTSPGDDIVHQLPLKCRQTDRPVAALIKDLKQRGLLDETLVIWSGEFGRTPMNEARDGSTYLGRDHHPGCFTIWMAGGGVKQGLSYGSTCEFGYRVTENPVHIHDFQATVMHLLGIDHERLTHRFQGRDYRLTDVHGHVVKDLMA